MNTPQNSGVGACSIRNSCLRYIVPFYIGAAQGGQALSFREVCACFDGARGNGDAEPLWKSYEAYEVHPDLYDHIAQWLQPRDGYSEICRSWTYAPFAPERHGGMEVGWQREDDVIETLVIVDLGVTVFVTGVGFLWYEVRQRAANGSLRPPLEALPLHETLAFGHAFKELNRTNSRLLDPTVPVTYVAADARETATGDESKRIKYLPDDRPGGGRRRRAMQQPIFGIWIRNLLLDVCADIRFFAVVRLRDGDRMIEVPDKALLYCFAVTDIEDQETLRVATCLLAKGYHEKYGMSHVVTDGVFDLFSNCGLYLSREGCAFVAGAGAETFHREAFRKRFLSIYFWITILMFQQTYTLLNFSRRVAETLPSDPGAYLEEDESYTERMDRLMLEINAFLVRSQFSSVSSIHHINSFYRYGCGRLTIDEDIDSLYDSLRALTDMQKSRRQQMEDRREKDADDKIEQTMRRLAALAIVSALCDSVGLISGAMGDLSGLLKAPSPWLIASIALWVALWALVLRIGFPALRNIWTEERERRRKRRKRRVKGRR